MRKYAGKIFDTCHIAMEILCIFVVILCIIGVLMHIITLFLLISTKRCHRIFQREYLITLCFAEIWLCISLCLDSTTIKFNKRSTPMDIFLIISYTGFGLFQYVTLTLIAIDKFTSIYMPLQYQSLTIKRHTRAVITFNAFVSLGVAVTFLSLYFHYKKDYAKVYHLISICVWLPCDVIVLNTLILVYGYFAAIRSKLKQSDEWRQLIVSTAILFSFTLFYVIPDIILVIAGHKIEDLQNVFFMMFTLNLICDALFMTFLNRELRKKLWKTVWCSNDITPQ